MTEKASALKLRLLGTFLMLFILLSIQRRAMAITGSNYNDITYICVEGERFICQGWVLIKGSSRAAQAGHVSMAPIPWVRDLRQHVPCSR